MFSNPTIADMQAIRSHIQKILLEEFAHEDIEDWMSGECIPFAVALKEIFPEYEIAALNNEYELDDEDAEYNFDFVHAFCFHPQNHNIIIDARGVRKLKDLYDEFFDINPTIDWDIFSSQQLIDKYAGKEFYSEESYDYEHSEYLRAKEWIENNKEKYQT